MVYPPTMGRRRSGYVTTSRKAAHHSNGYAFPRVPGPKSCANCYPALSPVHIEALQRLPKEQLVAALFPAEQPSAPRGQTRA